MLACRLKGISAEEMLVLEQVREAGNTGGHRIAVPCLSRLMPVLKCRNP